MYPNILDYIKAIKLTEVCIEQLKNLRPVLGKEVKSVFSSGNFAVVFKMKDNQSGKLYAVKCFTIERS